MTAQAIMIQGTCSNAGKSLLAAGLCRIFKQDGYRVAPFKSQNMALNSFITAEGLEMGRAQVVQAEAAGILPSVLMNPILLKPTNDTGSQVIVNGQSRGTMSAAAYFQYKTQLIPQVLAAYETLASQNDIMVLEGAGSPAEINLKAHDIVNMGMAKMAKAPVLLVGDIDRGGVFAALAGTHLLLEPEEKAMIKGWIINKFRGDREILKPGLTMIETITGIPVVGLVPYMDLDIDDEDSLTERFHRPRVPGLVDVAVVRLPRIANFTDFNPLECIPGLTLRYVKSVGELGCPDLLILPGTKNTMGDLLWLRQCGLEAAILKHAAKGGALLGICGGYQMLGQQLRDPLGVEQGGAMAGLGLLPLETEFGADKVRNQVKGHFCQAQGIFAGLAGVAFTGYEIHMGRTKRTEGQTEQTGGALARPFTKVTETAGGQQTHLEGLNLGNVYGSYIHGLFDEEATAKGVAAALFQAKGLDATQVAGVDMKAYKNLQYDRLAQSLRQSLDLPKIYAMLAQGI